MGLGQWLKPRAATAAGQRLYDSAVAQARNPALYLQLHAPDSVEGRFEVYTLHVVMLLHRLKGEGERAAEVAQALFDTYLKSLDSALREIGVGDLSVGKKMRKLGEAFYGRARNYDDALAALPDEQPLAEVLGRTVLEGQTADSAPLAAYAARAVASLQAQPVEAILEGRAEWPQQ
jgi:cytochrome b pre-mRNA-processing protein 3